MKRGLRLSDLIILESKEELARIPEGKVLINTINAHSYNVAQKDAVFAEALRTARSADETLSDASLRNADATIRGVATTKRHEGAYETLSGASLRNADATIRGDATTKRSAELRYDNENEGTSYETLSGASLRYADATIRGDATTKRFATKKKKLRLRLTLTFTLIKNG